MVNKLSEWSAAFLISACSYAVLFYLNDWLTSGLAYGSGVNWIYLPAGLRLFLTLVFALPGAFGIAIASFLICYFAATPPDFVTCVGIASISGFAPYRARIFVISSVPLAKDLSDLNLPKLVLCLLIFAFLSSGLHQTWFAIRSLDNAGTLKHFCVMFIGDVIGSILLIALIKYGLDLLKQFRKTTD